MQRKRSSFRMIGLVVLASITLIFLYFILLAGGVPVAGAQAATPASSSVTVVGVGTVQMQAEIATATIGVELLRDTVKEASTEVGTIMERVQTALLAQGIAPRDIQTRWLSIGADRIGPEDDQVRYRVRNSFFIRVRDLNSIGAVLDAAIDAGANEIYGVNFDLSNPGARATEARAKAMADARAQASELAELSGAGLGSIVEISELIGRGGGFAANSFPRSGDEEVAFNAAAGPIHSGELSLSMELQVTYELE